MRISKYTCLVLGVAMFFGGSLSLSALPAGGRAAMPARARLPFMENTGWADQSIRFGAHTFAGAVYVMQTGELLYAMPRAADAALSPRVMDLVTERVLRAGAVRLVGRQSSSARLSIFQGADPARWHACIPAFQTVEWPDAYPGINLAWRVYGRNIEKFFTVLPGADPQSIEIELEGIRQLRADAAGCLAAQTAGGELLFTPPVAYQVGAMGYEPVAVCYWVKDARYGFTLGAYDPTRPLVIDPLLGGTYLGGYHWDQAQAMVLDGAGRVYVAGITASPDFPATPGAYDRMQHAVFVSLFDNTLSELLSSTYLGGSLHEAAYAITLDGAGRVYVAGGTSSADFPTTPTAYQRALGSSDTNDVFISILSSDLSALLASTLLGGDEMDNANTLAVDADANVYVAGYTRSTNYPVHDGAFQNELQGWGDGFVSKLDGKLERLLASSYIGGSNYDEVNCLRLHTNGNVYITGITGGNGFPTTNSPYSDTFGGGALDGFVARMDNALTNVQAATYIGGATNDRPNALLVAPDDAVYLAGNTHSTNFPVTEFAFQTDFPRAEPSPYQYQGFIVKFDAGLHQLMCSTYLGGSANSADISAMAQDGAGNIWVAGHTWATNFPTTPGAYSRILNVPAGAPYPESDAYAARMDAGLSTMQAGTLLGGRRSDQTHAMQLDAAGNVFLAGYTESADFPTAPGAYERSYHVPLNFWHGDAFVAKLDYTLGEFPAPPFNLSASDRVYHDRIRVTWTLSDHADGYILWRGLDSNSANAGVLTCRPGEVNSWNDRAVMPGVTYSYWVQATNAGGISAFSSAAAGRRSAVAPVAADFDGDGLADPAIVVDGAWQVWQSGASYAPIGPVLGDNADRTFAAGDFDGDGQADPCAMDSNGIWKVWLSGSQYTPLTHPLASAGGSAVAADFDGDGRADPAVYLEDTWYFWMSGAAYTQHAQFTVGAYPDAVSLAGDFDGDGLADPALFEPATGFWTMWLSGNGYQAYTPSIPLAKSGALPAVGDFDGDGLADIVAYKLDASQWYAWLSSHNYVRSGPYL